MSKGNEPAYPGSKTVDGIIPTGLTKREYFAGLAMQALISGFFSDEKMTERCQSAAIDAGFADGSAWVAEVAANYADAALAELEKTA